MAAGKEIRDKIQSVKSTQKITSAMEMVAASKMRKAQEQMEYSRPYNQKISEVVSHVARSHSEYSHPFMEKRPVKKIGIILVSTDRGLCGGLNINLFRQVLERAKALEKSGIELCFSSIGNKGKMFLSRLKSKILSEISGLGDKPSAYELIGSIKVMLDSYAKGEIDEIHVAYNGFVNTMTQKPTVEQLLPLTESASDEYKHYWDYIYEPEAKVIIENLFTRYIESMVYQALVENIASEQSARMVAMKSATDNAGDLIDELELVYNKARQTAITAELADIVGGAAAV